MVLLQKLVYVSTVPGTRKVVWFSRPLCNDPDWLHLISPMLCPCFVRIKHIPHMHISITKWRIVWYGMALWVFVTGLYAFTFSMISIKVCVYFLVSMSWYCELILWYFTDFAHVYVWQFQYTLLNLLEPQLLMMVWDNQVLRYRHNNKQYRWFFPMLYSQQNTIDSRYIAVQNNTILHPAQQLRK